MREATFRRPVATLATSGRLVPGMGPLPLRALSGRLTGGLTRMRVALGGARPGTVMLLGGAAPVGVP